MNYKLKLTDITNPKTISDYLFLSIISNVFLIDHKDYMPMSSVVSNIHSNQNNCFFAGTEIGGTSSISYAGSALSISHDFKLDKDYFMEDFEYCYDELIAINFISAGLVSTAIETYKPDCKEKYADLIEELKEYDCDSWMVTQDKNLKLLEIVRILKKYGL